jgi:hypothetical protein
MEKVIIHTLSITKRFDKKLFQILLPENAQAITGIAVTVDKHFINVPPNPKIQREAGMLRLFVSDTGEKLFSQLLHASYRVEPIEGLGENYRDLQQWWWRSNYEMQDTWQRVESTVIDGYYEDRVGVLQVDNINYKVRIYLRLKML